jgi:hypothetical protein
MGRAVTFRMPVDPFGTLFSPIECSYDCNLSIKRAHNIMDNYLKTHRVLDMFVGYQIISATVGVRGYNKGYRWFDPKPSH